MSIWSRLRNSLGSRRGGSELDEELESHVAEAIRQGRHPEEARRAFGSRVHVAERSRDVRVIPWLDSLRSDIVFGWRQLAKRKVTSAAAILSLALAIGVCTSAFRMVDALLLRPLPVAHADRLYAVGFQSIGMDGRLNEYDSCSHPMFLEWRAALKNQAELVAVSYAERIDLTFKSDQDMEKAYRQYVSGGMFDTFGLQPALGRLLTAQDDASTGAHPYAVLSFNYWSRRFARDPHVLGRSVRIGNDLFEIVGVAGSPFTGTETGTITDVFLPMSMKNARTLASPNYFWLRTLVQLKPNIAPDPVRDELTATFDAFERERLKASNSDIPKKRNKETLLFEPAASGRSNLQRDYRRPLIALSILVALVLVIACANVANLLTAQAASRAREMALRVSIGAGRSRLVQLVMAESALIAAAAAAIGAIFSWQAAPLILRMIDSPDHPAQLVLPADWRVLVFSVALAAAVTILFGLMPALRASAVRPASALKGGEDPHGRRRVMHALIAAQVAFCFVVLFVTGLFVETFDRLSNQPMGSSAARILNLETVTARPQPGALWDQVADHLRHLPGVERVALTTWPLLSGESAVSNISINGAPPSDVFSDFLNISPGWFETMKVRWIDGRDFRPNESSPGVAIVNEAFARQFFNGVNPVGKYFDRMVGNGERLHLLIVGYAADARSRDNLRIPIRPIAYVPFRATDASGADQPLGRGTFVVRTSAENPVALASMLRREVPRARSEFRVSNIRTQTEINAPITVRERLLAMLALFFAFVALLLAGIGLYGVLDYSVLQQRREIGIRMALGARAAHVVRSITAEVFAMILTGAAIGVILGITGARYVATLLYGVKVTDFGIVALPALSILAAALLASLPAVLRAVHIDPAATLRTE